MAILRISWYISWISYQYIVKSSTFIKFVILVIFVILYWFLLFLICVQVDLFELQESVWEGSYSVICNSYLFVWNNCLLSTSFITLFMIRFWILWSQICSWSGFIWISSEYYIINPQYIVKSSDFFQYFWGFHP